VIAAVSAGAASAVIVVVVAVVIVVVVVAATFVAVGVTSAVVVSVFRQAGKRPIAPVKKATEKISSFRFLMSEYLPACAAIRASHVPDADVRGHDVSY